MKLTDLLSFFSLLNVFYIIRRLWSYRFPPDSSYTAQDKQVHLVGETLNGCLCTVCQLCHRLVTYCNQYS